MTVAVGEFIAKSKSWCKNDITSLYDSMTNAVTSDYGLDQHSQEPTYSLNSQCSCIDLIFTSQPNRSSRPGVFRKKGVLRNFAKFAGKHGN